MKSIAGCALLVAMTGIGFVAGMARVEVEPAVTEVIDLKVPLQPVNRGTNHQQPVSGLDAMNIASELDQSDKPVSDRRLDMALLQLETLNKQVSQLQRQVVELSDANSVAIGQFAEPAAAATQSKAQRAALNQQRINHVFAETNQALQAEAFDAEWTTSVHDSISRLIVEHRLTDTLIKDLQCGTTLCSVVLQQNPLRTASTNTLLENLAWQGFRLKKRDRNSIDGTNDVEVLIGRDGRRFEAANHG